MNMEDYAKFVVMAEDALVSRNTSKMKWLGLESRKQSIQRDMVFLEDAIQRSTHTSSDEICVYEDSIQSNLKKMKDTIVELRLDYRLKEQLRRIEGMTTYPILRVFMSDEVYSYYMSGKPMESLSFPVKKELYDKLKISLDESI
jgi:hypothetical protein